MVLKVLSGLKLKKDLTSVDLTYIIAIAGITCVADTATTVPCTATLSVYIRWYSCFNCTDTSDDTTALTNLTTPTLGNTTATVNAASSGSGDGSGMVLVWKNYLIYYIQLLLKNNQYLIYKSIILYFLMKVL